MTTQPHATLNNLRSVGVSGWLNKNDISLDSHASRPHKRSPPQLQPKSKDSHSSDTKQTIIPPFYSHSRSRTDSQQSQASFVTNHTDITASITEVIASQSKTINTHFHASKYNPKYNPSSLRKNYNPKYSRKSMTIDSTQIQSLQLITPRSCSNTPSRDRALCGSLIQQSRRMHSYHSSTSKSNAKTPKTLDPIIQNSNSDIEDTEQSIQTKSKFTNDTKLAKNTNTRSKKAHRKRSGSSLLSSSTKTSKNTHKSYKSKQSKSTILTKKDKQKQPDASTFRLDEWLSSMDILKYKEIFDRDGFDKLGAIVELNSDDLREMNIPKGHCKMILRQVHNLQNALNIKPLHTVSKHCRHRSNPDTNKHSKRKYSSHSTQSHSDPVIPPIDVILAFEDDARSNYESCDFPDIDASRIDLNKVHGHKHKTGHDKETVSSIEDTETVGYHTFPHTTSTIGSVLPPNTDIKHNKTPHTQAALQSLRVSIPHPVTAAPVAVKQVSDTSTSSLPSFHPTNLNEEDEKMTPNRYTEEYPPEYNMLPQYYRYQPPQQAQRYIVYYPPNDAMHYDDSLGVNKRYTYRHRRDYNHQTKRYFISDEQKESSHPRRHSISSTASNDYVLYQKAKDDKATGSGHEQDESHAKKKKKWLPSRVYKRRKKHSKSRSKVKHKPSNSGPLIAITSQKLLKTKSDKEVKGGQEEQCSIPWFLCGSSKNTHKSSKTSTPIIDTERTDTRASHVDISQIQTRKSAKSKSKSKSKTKSRKTNTIVSTPHDHSYSHNNSRQLTHHVTLNNNGSSQTITPYSSHHNHSGSSYASRSSSYDKTPEFVPRQAYIKDTHHQLKAKQTRSLKSACVGEQTRTNQENIMTVSHEEMDGANALNEAKELHGVGSLQRAADKYSEYLHYCRNDVDARIRYALCLLDLGEYDMCNDQLDSLIECDPTKNLNNSMLRFVYGLLQHKLENYSEALQHYNAALLTGYVYQDRIYNNLASLFRACKDYEKAEEYQLLALKMDMSNYVAYLNYAKILCDVHRYEDATQAYQNAISLRPDLVDLRVEFALFLMDLKEDYLLAATELNTAHKLSPENSEVDDLLKQAIEYCGNRDPGDSDDDGIRMEEEIGDDKSDTIVLLSPEQSVDERELFDVMEQLELNDSSIADTHRRSRKQSVPINLPKPPTAPSKTNETRSESTSPGFSPLKLAPRDTSWSKSTRKSICGALPPPHNPMNPNDPVRRNSLLNMNRSQLSHLRVEDEEDDAVSVMSDISMLSDEEQI